ncbi:MAG TPA: thioredoxin family protein [Planctomycetota bacterium]
MVKDLNDTGLEQRVTESDGLVAIAFLDYGSIPCDHFRPELDAVSDTLDGKVQFFKIDVTENPSITEELGVQAVPTLLVFREGEEIARYEGPYSREALNDRITALLAPKRSE